jgi:hypothetical protein
MNLGTMLKYLFGFIIGAIRAIPDAIKSLFNRNGV